MSITMNWYAYCGNTPGWVLPGYNRIVFTSGSAIANPVATGQYNSNCHLSSGYVSWADQCGSNHVPGLQYVDATHFKYEGGASQVLNDTNLTESMCTAKLVLTSPTPITVLRAGVRAGYAYNSSHEAHIYAFERGVSNIAWQLIYDYSAQIGRNWETTPYWLSTPGPNILIYSWYLAFSMSPESVGAKNNVYISPYVEYM